MSDMPPVRVGHGGPQLHHFLVQVFTASLCEHQHAECAALVGPDKLGVPWLSLNKHHCLTKSGFSEGFEPNVSSRFSILFHPHLQSLSPSDFVRSESKPQINLLFLFCAILSYTSHAVKESLRPTPRMKVEEFHQRLQCFRDAFKAELQHTPGCCAEWAPHT